MYLILFLLFFCLVTFTAIMLLFCVHFPSRATLRLPFPRRPSVLVMCMVQVATGRSHGSYYDPQPAPYSQLALLPSSLPPLEVELKPQPQSQLLIQARPMCGPSTVWLEVSSLQSLPLSIRRRSPRSGGEGNLNGRLLGSCTPA